MIRLYNFLTFLIYCLGQGKKYNCYPQNKDGFKEIESSEDTRVMGCTNCLLVAGVLVAILGYYVYYPFPDNAVEPWRQMFYTLPGRTNNHMCTFLDYIGIENFFNCSRRSLKLITPKKMLLSDLDLVVTDTFFDGVSVRMYVPRNAKRPLPGMVFIHGGGWVLLNVNLYDNLTRTIARSLKVVLISVEYRLAPEHPFPIPFEDCLKATKYFLRNAQKFGADPEKIVIAGDSAGGNLAMAVSLKLAKDKPKKLPQLKHLTLVYPILQGVDFNTPSYINYTYGPFLLNKRLVVKFVINYAFGETKYWNEFCSNSHTSKALKTKVKRYVDQTLLPPEYQDISRATVAKESSNAIISDDVSDIIASQEFSPLMSSDKDITLLPRTHIITAEYDPIRDDAMILAGRMRKLKHPVTHALYIGVQHGFFSTRSPIKRSAEALREYIEHMKQELNQLTRTTS